MSDEHDDAPTVAVDGTEAGVQPRGWVCLHRRIMSSAVFTCPQLFKTFAWTLLKASHCDRWVHMKTGRGGTQVKVEAGQFIYGRKIAAQELDMPESTVNERMQKLQRLGCISIQPGTHFSVVTICSWATYQDPFETSRQATQRPSDNQPAGNRQPTDTDNNLNHSNNLNKEDSGPTPDDVLAAWNQTAGVKRARELNSKRRATARTRLADATWEWRAALGKFPLPLCASDPNGWQPDFDWFLRPGSVTAILEGKYDWTKKHDNRERLPASLSRIRTPGRKPATILRPSDFAEGSAPSSPTAEHRPQSRQG